MKALVFDGALKLHRDWPVPRVAGEALVRIRLAGICSTDVELTRGYKAFSGVLGHEFVGEVVESPDPSRIGQRVCGEINVRCNACRYCRAGLVTHCANRTVLGIINRSGSFAEFLSLPPGNLHAVPDTLRDEHAVYVEPLAAAFEILEQVSLKPGDTVALLGDGKLGLLCAQVLRTRVDDVTLFGRHVGKMALAEAWGVTTRWSSEDGPLDFDVVVEATGSLSGLECALSLVRPRGIVVLKSTTAAPVNIDMSPAVVKEVTLVGSRCGPFAPALRALIRGDIQVSAFTEAKYPLDEGVAAMEHASRRGALKVLLEMT